MSSNFSKNLTCSMGISLGGLELATDFLFTNPEFYESELAEVKNSTFGQNVTKHSYEKPVRPKKTKEAIMHKFSLIHSNTGIQEDEIIESPVIVGGDTEFEFDFDFMQGTTEDNKIEIAEEPDTEIDDRVLEANSIMQRIANMNNVNESLIENGYEEDDIGIDEDIDIEEDIEEEDEEGKGDIDIEEDEEGDINIEEEDEEGDINIEEEDEEDNINIEEDEEGDIDIEEGIGIDEINIEEEDINIEEEEEEDEISIDEDDDEINIDEQHIIDAFENNFTPSTISNETTENENMNSKFNEDEVSFGENNIDEVSDLDIELDEDEDDIELNEDEDDIELDEDDIELDEDEDDIELDEDEDDIELNEDEDDIELNEDNISLSPAEESIEKQSKQSSEQVLKHTEKANTENIDKNTSESEELEQMKKRFAEMEKQLQELKSIKAKDKASNIKDNINKINNEDNILGAYKDKKTVENTNKHEQYSLMSIDALYNEVKDYMVEMGVKTRAIEVKALNEKFGELNIRKLIQKSYLIKIGSKGVTIGR